METTHRTVAGDARELASIDDGSVELVVTSPPYPMIEMWDDLFADLDPAIGSAIEAGDGQAAFDAMHAQLDRVWDELDRVLVDGGIACINVGDATRTIDGRFRVYGNHARIQDAFETRGFDPLPEVLWRKPTNSAAKFMGSGMVPPNAYVTLEHEYILVFRKSGGRRSFEPGSPPRYESAYFWEERNRWFSDLWSDVTGRLQELDDDSLRDRSGAFPFEIPYRLCCMYSVYGDTVLDPFWGTGTTSLAAMCAGRESIGVDLDDGLLDVFHDRVADVESMSERVARRRLERHRDFVERKRSNGERLGYDATYYDVPVTTKQERELRLYAVSETNVTETSDGRVYELDHEPLEGVRDGDRSSQID